MKIIVPVKRVIDTYTRARVKADGSAVVTENVKMGINPFCEIAVEQALKIKEKAPDCEVVVISAGASPDSLRAALAMGADRAIMVQTATALEPLAVAKVLAHFIRQEQPALTILGKQAIDGDNHQVGQMLAALLDWPLATSVSRLDPSLFIADDDFEVTREVDGGLRHVRLSRPAVVTVDLRLNEPRHPSLPNIMKARQKPLQTVAIETLDIDVRPRLTVTAYAEPPAREAGTIVDTVAALAEVLKPPH